MENVAQECDKNADSARFDVDFRPVVGAIYSMDNCRIAHTCVHDGRIICAATLNGYRRDFLDVCDMYEFNCDYGTYFTKIRDCACKEQSSLATTAAASTSTTTETSTTTTPLPQSNDDEPVIVSIDESNPPKEMLHIDDNDINEVVHPKKLKGPPLSSMNSFKLQDFWNCPNCPRPHSWATTVKGCEEIMYKEECYDPTTLDTITRVTPITMTSTPTTTTTTPTTAKTTTTSSTTTTTTRPTTTTSSTRTTTTRPTTTTSSTRTTTTRPTTTTSTTTTTTTTTTPTTTTTTTSPTTTTPTTTTTTTSTTKTTPTTTTTTISPTTTNSTTTEITITTENPTTQKLTTAEPSTTPSTTKKPTTVRLLLKESVTNDAKVKEKKLKFTNKSIVTSLYTSYKLRDLWNCKNCLRPYTWHTTIKGERRDFFRIL